MLVDDHPIVLDGLRGLLVKHADLRVVGETGDGLAALSLVEQCQPDIVLLDLALPGMGGVEITRQISRAAPHVQVIILSMHALEAYVVEALHAGARAYVLKKSVSGELIAAIHTVLGGDYYFSPPFSLQILEKSQLLSDLDERNLYLTLTERERQVLHLVIENLTNRQIAQKLDISHRTVEMYRANIYRKLGVRSTLELAQLAAHFGIHPPE